ncbi:MAG: hypothetical protein M3Z35_03065 [Nitrospirota bacterium]|nr:hypothetical protein [Nitrospirota bacterium]
MKGTTANPDTLRVSETILLVEDEVMVRGLARVILEGYGRPVAEQHEKALTQQFLQFRGQW